MAKTNPAAPADVFDWRKDADYQREAENIRKRTTGAARLLAEAETALADLSTQAARRLAGVRGGGKL
jgi:3-oxoacyl-[acyl-carrier-protein] synthase III